MPALSQGVYLQIGQAYHMPTHRACGEEAVYSLQLVVSLIASTMHVQAAHVRNSITSTQSQHDSQVHYFALASYVSLPNFKTLPPKAELHCTSLAGTRQFAVAYMLVLKYSIHTLEYRKHAAAQ